LKKTPKEVDKECIERLLISNCKLEKKGSQELLYRHFYGYAFHLSRLNTYSREEAIDVLNDSFIKVFNAIGKFQDGKSFKPWLKKIIVNTSVDNYRRKKKKLLCLEADLVSNPQIVADAISLLNVDDIMTALDQLPRLHRLVFTLYEIEGYSRGEISEMLEIAESSSRTFLTRAKKKMRIVLRNYSNPRR